MRKNRREEEKKILAEMEEAMAEKNQATQEGETPIKSGGIFADKTPQTIHCRKCQTLMQKGVCPACGYTMYVPMDKKTQQKIRWIIGGVCVIVFILLLLIL